MVEKAPRAATRRLRMPRAARMRSRGDFQRAYRVGARARGEHILVVAAPPPEGVDGPRLGLSVGRRFERRAVGRNRVRRLLREAFRLERHALPPLDLILIPQRAAAAPTLEELRHELLRLAAKAARRLAERAAAAAPDAPGGPPA